MPDPSWWEEFSGNAPPQSDFRMATWDEVAPAFRDAYPDLQQDQLRRVYEDARNIRIARERYRNWTPPPVHTVLQGVPGGGTWHNARIGIQATDAARRISAGSPEAEDYNIVAGYERIQTLTGQRSVLEELGHLGLNVTRLLGEAGVAGRAFSAAAAIPYGGAPLRAIGLTGEAAPAFTRVSPYGGLGAASGNLALQGTAGAARVLATTAAMPSMYAEQAVQNAQQHGGDWYEMRNLAPAFAIGAINTAILGQVQNGVGVGGMQGFILRTGAGLGEQQLADIGIGLIGEATENPRFPHGRRGYGLVGDWVNSRDDSLHHAASQVITFALFSAMHNPTRHESPIVRAADEFITPLRERGIGERAIAEELFRTTRPMNEWLAENPNLTRPEARDRMDQYLAEHQTPEHVKGMMEALISSLPERPIRPEDITRQERQTSLSDLARPVEPTQTLPEARPGVPTPERAQTPAEPPVRAPETTPEARSQLTAQSVDQSGVGKPKKPMPTDPVERVFHVGKESGLTHQELQVLLERSRGRGFEDIGADLGVTKQRVEQIEKDALAKVEAKGSIKTLIHDAMNAPEIGARSDVVVPETISAEGAATVSAQNRRGKGGFAGSNVTEQAQSMADMQTQLQGLYAEYKKEQKRGTITEEKRANYQRRIRELDARIAEASEAIAPSARPESSGANEGAGTTEAAPAEATNARVADDITKVEVREMFSDGRLRSIGGGSGLGTGPIGKAAEAAAEWVKGKINAAHDSLRELGGAMVPRTQRLSEKGASAVSRFLAADVFVADATPFYIDKVLGADITPEKARLFGSAFGEMRFRYAREALHRRAVELWQAAQTEKDPAKRKDLIAQSAEFDNTSRDVRTFIGRENAPQTEAEYQAILQSPEFQGILQRWKSEFVPVMEKFFRMAEGLDPNDPIERLTQIPELPFSMKALRPGDPVAEGVVMTGAREGNLKNPVLRKLGAAREFTGSAEGYHVDLRDIIANTLHDRVGLATKAEMYRVLESEGLAKWSKRGAPLEGFKEIPGVSPPRGTQEATGIETSLYVKDAIYKEVRKALRVDAPWPKIPGADLATRATLMSIVEAATHSKNLATANFQPGVHPVEVVKNAWKVITKDQSAMKQLVDLAEIGATKGKHMESVSLTTKGGMYNPLNWMSSFLNVVDSTMRLSMEDAFKRLASQGRVQNTESNKRDFINQALGQYNKAAQNSIVAFLRETGLGPFATAGTTYTIQGLRALTLDPGVKATSYGHALGLRVEKLARMAVVLAAAPLINFLAWKRWDGDDNTPLGAVKTGVNKEGKTQYIDLAAFTGVRRGARLIGLNALAEGSRQGAANYGTTRGEIADRAIGDFATQVSHPAQGPIVNFLWTGFTGHNTIGMRLAPEQDAAAKWQAAVMNANPVVAVTTGADRPVRASGIRQNVDFWEQFWKMIGPFGLKTSARPPGAPRSIGGMQNRFR